MNIVLLENKQLENTERAIKNGKSRETGNIGYKTRRTTKLKHNTAPPKIGKNMIFLA
jgi:hypothetical protein